MPGRTFDKEHDYEADADAAEVTLGLTQDGEAEENQDRVYHPPHYTQYKGMEPFTFLMLNEIPFAEGSVIKYVLRWKQKNGIEDLQKARRVIDMMIELETNKEKYLPEVRAL